MANGKTFRFFEIRKVVFFCSYPRRTRNIGYLLDIKNANFSFKRVDGPISKTDIWREVSWYFFHFTCSLEYIWYQTSKITSIQEMNYLHVNNIFCHLKTRPPHNIMILKQIEVVHDVYFQEHVRSQNLVWLYKFVNQNFVIFRSIYSETIVNRFKGLDKSG